MKNFGLDDLRLVRPDEFDAYRLEGIAHRTADLIEACTIHDTLDEAIADATYVVGTTARARTAGRTYARARDAARLVAERATLTDPPGRVSLLFGREDRGLTNEALDQCHAVAIIPTDPEYSSLNLAQAALVLAYEIFLVVDGGLPDLPRGRRAMRPPTQQELEQMFDAVEEGLSRIDFYKARKTEAVMRTLRTIITRAEPDLRETRLLAAIGYEIGHFLDREGP
jgi:TrmH family RNA methyltransferase